MDPSARTTDGWTAAYFSAVCGYGSCLEVLLNYTTVKLNEPYKDGRTLLHYAVETNRLDFVEVLLKYGASLDVYTVTRQLTPVHVAVRNGCEVCVALLLNHGAKLEVRSLQGFTSLHHAVRCGQYEVVNLLLSEGAQVNAVSGLYTNVTTTYTQNNIRAVAIYQFRKFQGPCKQKIQQNKSSRFGPLI